jgi:hypothetical protein
MTSSANVKAQGRLAVGIVLSASLRNPLRTRQTEQALDATALGFWSSIGLVSVECS